MERRLYRSTKNKIIAGVAGGLGEYFDIDPVLIRIIFVVATLASGFGFLAYILLWIVVPKAEFVFATSSPGSEQSKTSAHTEGTQPASSSGAEGGTAMSGKTGSNGNSDYRRHGSTIGGTVLIVLGLLFLADNYMPIFHFSRTWPLILIAIGAAMMLNSTGRISKKGESHES